MDGKTPRSSHGLRDAGAGAEQIDSWWRRWPDAGVAIRTGAESGLLVLDIDGEAGLDTLRELEHGEFPATVTALTGGGGQHLYFRHPGEPIANSAGKLGAGIDTRGDGGYVVAPPSRHPSGRRYERSVDGHPEEVALAPAPAWMLAGLHSRNRSAPKLGAGIPQGQRDSTLASLAGTMRRRGMDEAAIAVALAVENTNGCQPPLPDSDVERIAHSISRYEPAEDASPSASAPVAISDAIAVFERWLALPDPGAVYAVLGTLAAHHLNREPVWTLLVAPGGSGKTEILQAAAGLAEVFPAATLTEPALLSGTATKERSKGATGGLLVQIGESGVLLCKDFGSVLSMHRESRGQVLAALREVYDGEWTRHVGVDGGKTLSWRGKIGFIGGCTPTIDRAHAVMASMGERFLLYRLPKAPPNGQAVQALEHAGREADAGIVHSPHRGSQDQHAGRDAHESRGRAARKSERRTLPLAKKRPPAAGERQPRG